MLRFRPEVQIRRLDERLATILREAAYWSETANVDVEINSIDDPAPDRSPATLHGRSLAVDLDTIGDKPADLHALADSLRVWLDPQYDILLESDHVHVEWDARRGPLRRTF